MAYALMQKDLTAPDVDRLKRAFRTLPTLRDLDAQTAANDAYGIFLRGLDVESASVLQDALFREGVTSEVVEESHLPAIPPAKLVRQVELLPEQLVMYDPMRRAFRVPWRDIMFIAAGNVRLQDFRRGRSAHDSSHSYSAGNSTDRSGDVKSREQSQFHLMLEIVLISGSARYSITADDFVFDHLGPKLTNSLPANFALLVQELAQFAPHVGLNRGAFLACEKVEEVFAYPSKAAFFEEMTWMLWRISQLARGAGI